MGAHRILRGRTGAACNMGEAHGARDVDAAVDRGDPGGAGEGMDDAGGAENRQAAHDPEARVPSLLRQRLAAGDRDLDLGRRAAQLRNRLNHHLPRHGVDRRLARRHRKSAARDHAHTRPGAEADAVAPFLDRGHHHAAMGDVRIIARILDDARPGPAWPQLFECERKARRFALRQSNRYGVREHAGAQCRKCRFRCRRCASARGPAPP